MLSRYEDYSKAFAPQFGNSTHLHLLSLSVVLTYYSERYGPTWLAFLKIRGLLEKETHCRLLNAPNRSMHVS